jgi:hypothetical protein
MGGGLEVWRGVERGGIALGVFLQSDGGTIRGLGERS